jgi:flagellar biosynthesis anti-sigma factor FlgM
MEISKSAKPGIEARNSGSQNVRADRASGKAAAAPEPGKATESGDKVTLTSAAQRLLEAASDGEQGAPVNQARVEALRQSIEDGTYQVDPGQIAQALWRADN